jgi:hypothetical protein
MAAAEAGISEFADKLAQVALDEIDCERLFELHKDLREQALRRADRAFGVMLVWLLAATNLDAVAVQAFRDTTKGRWVNKGLRTVEVELPGQLQVPLTVTYLLQKEKRRAGRPNNHGNRGETGNGIYPALEALGIASHRRLTPLAEEVVCQTATACDDFRTGFEMADKMGVKMSWKAYHDRFGRLAQDVESRKKKWLDEEQGPALYEPERWANRRILVATDGGRTRIRENYKGAPRASGYHGFVADWREPKLFVVYALDEEGRPARDLEPIVDGTFGDADACFEQLMKTLRAIGVERADEVAFLGDGARWIWQRARPALEELGVDEERIVEGVDWYHAASTVAKLSELPVDWSEPKRHRWRKRALDLLYEGEADEVAEMVEKLSDALGASEAADKVDYFADNAERMRYDELRERNLPEGSGAVESAIRRVVNLRMKGNAKYWLKENAEAMITLRGALKTNRFGRLMSWYRRHRSQFWTPSNRRLLRCHRHQESRVAA